MVAVLPAGVPLCVIRGSGMTGQQQKACQWRISAGPRASAGATEQWKGMGFEDRRQQQAGGKTPHMRPPGDTRLMGIAEGRADQLQHEPETHHPERAERKGIEDDAQRYDDSDART